LKIQLDAKQKEYESMSFTNELTGELDYDKAMEFEREIFAIFKQMNGYKVIIISSCTC
jgi:hypothetical protein